MSWSPSGSVPVSVGSWCGRWLRSVGGCRGGHALVWYGTGGRLGFAAGVGGAQGDDGGGQYEAAAGQQGSLVAGGDGDLRRAGGEQVLGAGGGDGGQERQA